MTRRTLAKVGQTPAPQALYDKLMRAEGWPYAENRDYYLCRDRALVSVMYVGELRVSEAIRLKHKQFEDTEEALLVHEVLLSKTHGDKERFNELRLPKIGDRAPFTQLILEYLKCMMERKRVGEKRLFPWSLEKKRIQVGLYRWKKENKTTPLWSVQTVGTRRAWQIVNALLPELTQHWLRVYGEKYLYRMLGKDIIAVSKIVKVDPRTAIKYLMAGEEEYPVV